MLGSAAMPPIPPKNPPKCPDGHPIPTDLERETHHIGFLVRNGICPTCYARIAADNRKRWAERQARRGYEVARISLSTEGIELTEWIAIDKKLRERMTAMWMAPSH